MAVRPRQQNCTAGAAAATSMFGCLALLAFVRIVHAVDATSINISLEHLPRSRPMAMGQTVHARASWAYSDKVGSALVAFPFLNGSQWGAPVTLTANGVASTGRSSGSRTLAIPIPHAGLASLILVVVERPLAGVTVGLPLSSLRDLVAISNSLNLTVRHRAIVRLGNRRGVHFGSQWEPAIAADGVGPGGGGTGWSSNEAVPLVGRYSAFDYSVLKQHAIWLAESGIDSLLVDWSNNIGSTIARFDQIPAMSWKIINGTTFALRGYERLHREGIPCPKIALMMGVFEPPLALNGQLQWVRENYAPSAFVTVGGQPLLLMLDGGGPPSTHELAIETSKQLNTSGFAVRFTSAFLSGPNQTAFPRAGWWSWMDDGAPTVARRNGVAESVTISAAFFRLLGSKPGAKKGWLQAPSLQTDRRGGATFVRSMVPAFQTRPEFVWIHQWNEFIGVVPNHAPVQGKSFFGDEYNTSMSDDIEPSDLYECGSVRPGDTSCGGWGFLFVNLQRALVSMLVGAYPDNSAGETTSSLSAVAPSLLTVAAPTHREPILVETDGGSITVRWVQLGARATHYVLAVCGDDGPPLARKSVNASIFCNESSSEHSTDGKGRALYLSTCEHDVSLDGAGSLRGHTATLTVESMIESPGGPRRVLTPFPLSLNDMDDHDSDEWVPATASVAVVLGPPFPSPPG